VLTAAAAVLLSTTPAVDAAVSRPTAQVQSSQAASWCSEVDLPSSGRPGTYILRDNFESGTLSKWTTRIDEGDAWAGVTDDYAVTGNCAGRLIVTSSWDSRANVQRDLPDRPSDVWAVGWFRILKEGYAGSNVPTFRFFTDSSRILDVHRQNLTGDLWLRTARGDGSWKYVKLNKWMALNRWYRIEVHVGTDWSNSRIDVLVDGQVLYSTTSYYLPVGHLTTAMIGSEHVRQKMDVVFDDVVIKGS
jgi:hypothetical protein